MAGDKVKKGFGFYLFMLLLLLLAAFLIIVMVMLFSPGTSILGYKYFSYNYSSGKEIVQTETTASSEESLKTPLNFDQINEFVINCDYANVIVSKSNDEKSQDCVKITNTAKGFAREEAEGSYDETSFAYTIKLNEDGDKKVLTISVTEPKGFLYFSKNIVINVCAGINSTLNFSRSTFTITTNSGKVSIDENLQGLKISNLTVSTDTGSIALAEKYQAKEGEKTKELAFNSLYLTTNNGKVSTPCNILVANDAKFSINGKGSFNLQNVTGYRGVQLVVNNGNFKSKEVVGSVKVLNLIDGVIEIENIYKNTSKVEAGEFESNKTDKMNKATIKLGLVGDLSIPFGNKSRIEIGTLKGQSLIRTTSGSVIVNKALTAPCIIQTATGNVDLKIDDSNIKSDFDQLVERKHVIESDKGNVVLRFASSVQSLNDVRTQGNVEIVMQKDSKFLLVLNTYDNKPIHELSGNVIIENVDNDQYEYQFRVNYVDSSDNALYLTNRIDVFANGKINAHFDHAA